MTPELRAHNWVVNRLGKTFLIDRIETSTKAGMADLNITSVASGDIWIELKARKPPILQRSQLPWLVKRAMAGSRVAVLAVDVECGLWSFWWIGPVMPNVEVRQASKTILIVDPPLIEGSTKDPSTLITELLCQTNCPTRTK